MIKLLAIGNSFSQDAMFYLHDIAKTDGIDLKTVNLYIGGCSLETHWNNIESDASAYDYELNGTDTGRKTSIKEALQEDDWDYVILQQVSGYSGLIDTYYPFINHISEYVRLYAPQAKQLIHQTWAYELDSEHPDFKHYDNNQITMYHALTETYHKVAAELSLPVIPSGDVLQSLRTLPVFDYANEGISLCRDGFHMNYIYGRYAVAAAWYEFILGRSILGNTYMPSEINNEEAEDILEVIKVTVHQVIAKL